VTDLEGRPIGGATVKERHEYGFRKLSTQSDEDGFYTMRGLADPWKSNTTPREPELESSLAVQAQGMSPQFQKVRLRERTNTVNFVLAPGNIFRGRVVDETGNPISGAVVKVDSCFNEYVPNRFEWLTYTDSEGRFEWNSAPAEETCFWFEADGYEVIRGRPMVADGTGHEIKLTRKVDSTATRR
jgi:hypothetical protein